MVVADKALVQRRNPGTIPALMRSVEPLQTSSGREF
jgi:hypothetical protein